MSRSLRASAFVMLVWSLAGSCANKPPAVVAPGEDRNSDNTGLMEGTPPPWTGQRVDYGVAFALAVGEQVAFGDNGPVLELLSDSSDDTAVLHVVVQRFPPDEIPGGVPVKVGSTADVGGYSIRALTIESGPPRQATLSMRETTSPR